MMIPLEKVRDADVPRVGGKAVRLAAMARAGLQVPQAICLTGGAYLDFLSLTRIGERIGFELNRKPFESMRWEEIWDAALRIRNLFINTSMPDALSAEIERAVKAAFGNRAVAVRSSSCAEDSAERSFAGLHESYVDLKGPAEVADHVKLVWASLWSDRALLYRREMGLDRRKSAMPVLIQAMQAGDCSGVAFSKSPDGSDRVVIEAVFGLNQGLVEGTVEPDRWIVDRDSRRCVTCNAPSERKRLVSAAGDFKLEDAGDQPPLSPAKVDRVFDLALEAEALFKAPQDVEWTLDREALFALQSRPITTLAGGDAGDDRPWYLSLRRSFENLKALRRTIEEEVLPGMEAEARALSRIDASRLSGTELASEIEKRQAVLKKWRDVYWRDCIPFAHGMRLFGQVYNDRIKPADPFEFMSLLGTANLAGIERNRRLQEMAALQRRGETIDERLDEFIEDFGIFSRPDAGGFQGKLSREQLLRLIEEMAKHPPGEERTRDLDELKRRYFSRFEPEKQAFANELLDLGRASYRLRDDDNIYLERVEQQLTAALEEGRKRIGCPAPPAEVVLCLRDPGREPVPCEEEEEAAPAEGSMKARQLVGQPAGPGVVRALARVIDTPDALFQFKKGEVLVCDAVDPGMTFVVPLASGIVERRGGMLIHGAIIAREYGLPCVTGVPEATSLIRTGDRLTVDGYLGLVIVG
jgi:pyruvate,water dikinase